MLIFYYFMYRIIYIYNYSYPYFLKYVLLIILLQLSQIFLLLSPSAWYSLSVQQSPPWGLFMSMGHACKFFGFSISYSILNILLSILYLPIMLLNPCTFSPLYPFSHTADNPPNGIHIYDSVPVLLVCLVLFF